MCQVNGKAEISTPHSSHIFQPILMTLETKKDIRDTTQQAKFGWCVTTGRGLRREGIFRYFYPFSVFLLTPTGHTRKPITTVYGSKRVFLHKVGPLGGLNNKKIMFGGQNSPKNMILGGLNRHCKPNLRNIRITISRKVRTQSTRNLKGISYAQMHFVGGPALQNYNSRWRQPPSWIFARTSLTQPPIDVDEWNFAVM